MDTLIKKFYLVGTIKTDDYMLGWDIYNLVVEDKCEVVSIQPIDNYYPFIKLNIKDKEEWITYGDCREMTFHYINERIVVEVKTYTYDKFGIKGRFLKWKAEFVLHIDFVTKIQTEIDKAFDKFCDKAYDNHLEFLRLQWIEKFKEGLLNK